LYVRPETFEPYYVHLNRSLLVVGTYIKSRTLSMPLETINMTLVPPTFIPKLNGFRIFSNQFFENSI
jgi:hypothetical protein